MTQTDEERRARDRAYAARPEVKERRNAAKRQRIAENRWRADPEKQSAYWLLYRYGITPEERQRLLDLHDGQCWLDCGRQATVVDHTEVDGQTVVRGMLCSVCNCALGVLGDDESGLIRALEYLRDGSATKALGRG